MLTCFDSISCGSALLGSSIDCKYANEKLEEGRMKRILQAG